MSRCHTNGRGQSQDWQRLYYSDLPSQAACTLHAAPRHRAHVLAFPSSDSLNQSHLETLSYSSRVSLWPGGKQDKTVIAHLLWPLCTRVVLRALLTLRRTKHYYFAGP